MENPITQPVLATGFLCLDAIAGANKNPSLPQERRLSSLVVPGLTRSLTVVASATGMRRMALVYQTVATHLIDQSQQEQLVALKQQLERLEAGPPIDV